MDRCCVIKGRDPTVEGVGRKYFVLEFIYSAGTPPEEATRNNIVLTEEEEDVD